MMDLRGRIESLEQLTACFPTPNDRARAKERDRLNPAMAAFVDQVSFVVLSTSDGVGSLDASPRGGPPGFIRSLDERHIAIPDLRGNNRIDSYRNLVRFPYAGLLLMVPGRDETLRVNGPAALTDDADILAGFTNELRPPKLAIVIETAEVYGHCAKAFRRGRVWRPDAWVDQGVPDLAAIYACEFDFDEDAMRATLSENYAADLALD